MPTQCSTAAFARLRKQEGLSFVFDTSPAKTCSRRWVSPREAVVTAEFLAKTNGKTFDRIIITDGGDDTVFYWERGKGITWLTPEERTK